MKIKHLGTLHMSSGKLVNPLNYSHLNLTFRLLLCAWILVCSWNKRGALWRQSCLLSCSLWTLSTFFRVKMLSGKADEGAKSKISSLSWQEVWHSILKAEDWYVPTHSLRRQDNVSKTHPTSTIEFFRLVFELLCLVCHHLIHMYPAELCKLSESKTHPYIKFHVATQTPLQNVVVFYHSGNGTLQNCHCFLAVWLASQCHGCWTSDRRCVKTMNPFDLLDLKSWMVWGMISTAYTVAVWKTFTYFETLHTNLCKLHVSHCIAMPCW